MPAPLLVAGIAAGAQLGAAGINAMATGKMNKKTRKWNEHMYGIQRKDALSDWAMQNEYNHPSSQMARLRAAGLNPNLVYGEGNINSPSANIKSTDVKSWDPKAPQYDLGSVASAGIDAYYTAQMREAQVDNLRAQNTVHLQEALLKAAQTVDTTQSSKTKEFDLMLKNEIKDYSVDAAALGVQKLAADITYTLDQNERQAAMNASNLREAAERILNYRLGRAKTSAEIAQVYQTTENLKKDGRLKQLDIELREKGIMPTDPMYMRMLARLFEAADGATYKESVIGGHEKSAADSIQKRLERFRMRK